MRHPIEICLTACEWLEKTRGQAAAGWARKEVEKKTVLTFLAQGAAGGTVGYFLVMVGVAIAMPVEWSIVYCFFLPINLVLGAMVGAVAAVLIWLTGVLLKRKLKFVARTIVVTVFLAALQAAQCYLLRGSRVEQWPMAWIVVSIYMVKLPIVLLTGSSLRFGHLLILGAGPRSRRYNLGSWLSFPAGFLLRVASVFGLLEALMTHALWLSTPSVDLPTRAMQYAARAHLSAIALAVLYFAASSYLSVRTPRKGFLLPTVILLNVPLACLIVYVGNLDTPIADFLHYPLLTPIGLWVVYLLARLVAPEPAVRLVAPVSAARRVTGSWAEDVAILKLSPQSACRVQS